MNKQKITKQDMLKRIDVLSDELDANEAENRMLQHEIDDLYEAIDSGEFE